MCDMKYLKALNYKFKIFEEKYIIFNYLIEQKDEK